MDAMDTTVSDHDPSSSASAPSRDSRLGIVILWAKDAPERVGELVAITPADRRVHVLGRGLEPARVSTWVRALPTRERPGRSSDGGPLDLATLSREQLRFQALDDTALAIENIGKRALFVAGLPTTQAVVRIGDSLRVDGVLVGLCVARTVPMPALAHVAAEAWPAFGAPDAHGLIGEGPLAWTLRDTVAFVAEQSGHVLVHGPIGSGLGLVARAIAADDGDELDVSELDASELVPALVHHADAGRRTMIVSGLEASADHALRLTRLFDDVAVSLRGQRRSLRIVARLPGDPSALPPHARAAFRHVVAVPGLAERREDVPLIARHLVDRALAEAPALHARFTDATGRARLAPELVEQLVSLPLAHGARDVSQALWRALGASTGNTIDPAWSDLRSAPAAREATEPPHAGAGAGEPAVEVPPGVHARLPLLTKTERVIVQHLALSRTSQQIARTMFLSVRTVQNHRARICRKLELSGHHALLGVALALRATLGRPVGG